MTGSPTTTVMQPQPGLDVTLREAGHGAPVLVLHGGAGPDSIDSVVTHIAANHRALAPIHPGFGDTKRPETLNSAGDLAHTYLNLLDHIKACDTTVIGSSFGGWVATEMALADDHHRIKKLVLIDAIGPQIPGHDITTPKPNPAGATAQQQPRRGPSPAALAALRAYTGDGMQDTTLLQRATRITIPTLLLWGENDPIVTPDFGRAYARAFPDGRFTLIPGAGHLPMREAPELTYAALDGFLNDPREGHA
ncbi:alpha/beta fold hydrolase [Actinoplanes sp. TFC3]|uniref:alpha/beta fold hydrolase n=1 Tax=Actinoplanes sp. TFC3 TaxID=1710355 RepID=UPI00191C6C71|nr:alpha/beta hydrolase [Actinoplanes sp. TFC3]